MKYKGITYCITLSLSETSIVRLICFNSSLNLSIATPQGEGLGWLRLKVARYFAQRMNVYKQKLEFRQIEKQGTLF